MSTARRGRTRKRRVSNSSIPHTAPDAHDEDKGRPRTQDDLQGEMHEDEGSSKTPEGDVTRALDTADENVEQSPSKAKQPVSKQKDIESGIADDTREAAQTTIEDAAADDNKQTGCASEEDMEEGDQSEKNQGQGDRLKQTTGDKEADDRSLSETEHSTYDHQQTRNSEEKNDSDEEAVRREDDLKENIPNESNDSQTDIPGSKHDSSPIDVVTTPGFEDPTGFRYMDVNLLKCFVSKFPCPECLDPNLGYSNPSDLKVREKKIGLASILEFACGSCGVTHSMSTSARAGPSYEINARFNAAMFNIQTDFNKAKRFCTGMKAPDPLSFRTWTNKTA